MISSSHAFTRHVCVAFALDSGVLLANRAGDSLRVLGHALAYADFLRHHRPLFQRDFFLADGHPHGRVTLADTAISGPPVNRPPLDLHFLARDRHSHRLPLGGDLFSHDDFPCFDRRLAGDQLLLTDLHGRPFFASPRAGAYAVHPVLIPVETVAKIVMVTMVVAVVITGMVVIASPVILIAALVLVLVAAVHDSLGHCADNGTANGAYGSPYRPASQPNGATGDRASRGRTSRGGMALTVIIHIVDRTIHAIPIRVPVHLS